MSGTLTRRIALTILAALTGSAFALSSPVVTDKGFFPALQPACAPGVTLPAGVVNPAAANCPPLVPVAPGGR